MNKEEERIVEQFFEKSKFSRVRIDYTYYKKEMIEFAVLYANSKQDINDDKVIGYIKSQLRKHSSDISIEEHLKIFAKWIRNNGMVR